MKEIEINSLNELYTRVYPALNTKKNELALKNIRIKEIDIWNYLKKEKWFNSKTLDLYTIVADILSVTEQDLFNFLNKN